MTMIPFDDNLAEKSARYLALLAALGTPATPNTAEDARSAELARILAYAPETLAEATGLAERLLFARDFAAGVSPGVQYDIESLSEHYGASRKLLLSAAKLCGAMPFADGVWADSENVRFNFDREAIEHANASRESSEL